MSADDVKRKLTAILSADVVGYSRLMAASTVQEHDMRAALEIAAKINQKSPTANRMAKFALNLIDDGLVGQQVFAGEATRLAYMTDEAKEGRNAFLEKRAPDFRRFPRRQ